MKGGKEFILGNTHQIVNMSANSDSVANGLQPESSSSSSDSRESDFMNISEDEGWEDAEAEDEDQEVKGLFSNDIFQTLGPCSKTAKSSMDLTL